MQPLHDLLPNHKFTSIVLDWSKDAATAFNTTKEALGSVTLLSYLRPDVPYLLDSRCFGFGCRFSYDMDPISFFLKKTKPTLMLHNTKPASPPSPSHSKLSTYCSFYLWHSQPFTKCLDLFITSKVLIITRNYLLGVGV